MKNFNNVKKQTDVSRLGLGGSSLPAVPENAYRIMNQAINAGIAYVDMAPRYVNNHGIELLSQVMRHNPSASFTFGYKYPHWAIATEREFFLHIEDLLRVLNLPFLDYFLFWGLTFEKYKEYEQQGSQFEWVNSARHKGLIRKVGFTANDGPSSICRMIDTFMFESVTLELNLLHTANLPAIHYAYSKSLEVNVHGIMGGGRLGRDSGKLNQIVPDILRTAELALRYVLGVDEVHKVMLGVSGEQQLAENLLFSRKGGLLLADRQRIDQFIQDTNNAWEQTCDSCGACSCCPKNVAVMEILRLYKLIDLYDISYYPWKKYNKLLQDNRGYDQCDLCMKCVIQCKLGTPVLNLLAFTHTVLNKTQGVNT